MEMPKDDQQQMVQSAEAALLPSEPGQAEAVARWRLSLNSSGPWPDCSVCVNLSSEGCSEDCIDYSDCIHNDDCEDNWLAAEHIYVRTLAMAQSPLRSLSRAC